jgi:hypothetical protein
MWSGGHRASRYVVIAGILAFFAVALGVTMYSRQSPPNIYVQKILVANWPGFAPDALIDPHLINPWGIGLRPPGAGGHIWISNAGNLSTSTFIGDANGDPLHQDGLKIVYFEKPVDFVRGRPRECHRSGLQRGQRFSGSAAGVSGGGAGE